MDKCGGTDRGGFRNVELRQCRGIFALCAVALLVSICTLPEARAEVFDNDYLRFRLPDGWKCQLEDDVFVCQAPLPKGHKYTTIIMLTAKIASEEDTLPDYIAHLRQNLAKGSKGPSLVEGPRINNGLGKVSWVEATHLGSEIPYYYTTYFATTTDGLSIVVTFSAHQRYFQEFRKLIAPCIQSLQVKSDWKKHKSVK
jgi:hypothetical protein